MNSTEFPPNMANNSKYGSFYFSINKKIYGDANTNPDSVNKLHSAHTNVFSI